MSDNLKARLSLIRLRLEVLKAKKSSGGYSRHPAGSSKGGQFAPKSGFSAAEAAFFGGQQGGNTFQEVGGPGWGHYTKPSAPPPGAKPHPAGVNDKGQPVTVNYPSKPSDKSTWSNKDATATFVPGGDAPKVLNNVPMKSWTPPKEGWHAVTGNNERLEALFPFERPSKGMSTGAGVLIVEPDGRIWLTKPTNEFGGYKQTYPKGTVESGLTMQQNAIKEAWEETGLKIKITGVLGDYDRTTSRARMYIAERVGGTPKDMGWESQAVRLSTMKDAKALLNMGHDKKILDDLQALMEIGKSKGGAWQNQPRWPGGSPLGGQWKTMGADGLTVPPLIAGGLEKSNANYQKAANGAHAAAQKGDISVAKQVMDKYGDKYANFVGKVPQNSHGKWGAQTYQYAAQLVLDHLAKVNASATVDRLTGPMQLSSLTQHAPKPGGSNPGAIYKDDKGTEWLVKGSNAAATQSSAVIADRSKNEVLAAKLVLAAGGGAPDMKLVELEGKYGGGLGVASKMIDGLSKMDLNEPWHMANARADFAIHAWLANYDVLGQELDNTMFKDGKAFNIDTGGALLFRAQGAKKDETTGLNKDGVLKHDAPEFESMRVTNSYQQAVFGTMTAEQLKVSAEKLNNISDKTITDLVNTYGPGDAAFKQKLAESLIARKNAILVKAGVAAAAPTAPPAALPAGEVDLASIKTGAMAPTLSKTAFKGENKLFFQQYHPSNAMAAGTMTMMGQAPSALAKETAKMIKAAVDAGYKYESFKVSGLQQAYVYVKDGKVLTENGAKALLVGASAQPAAPAPKVAPTPPKKEEVEAQHLAAAMKEVKLTTTSINNKVAANPNVNIPPPSGSAAEKLAAIPGYGTSAGLQNIANGIDKAYAAGDMSALAMAKVGLDATAMAASPGSPITKVTTTLTEHTLEAMDHLAFKAAKDALKIADNAPKVTMPAKPAFTGNKFDAYYKGLVDKAEQHFNNGNLMALQAMKVKTGGKPAWPTDTANGKAMETWHSALVAKLEQKGAAEVVARVNQAHAAMQKPVDVPTPAEAAQKALPAMPNFAEKKIPLDNKNASTHNNKVEVIADLAAKGDVNGLLSLGYGVNTYGKKQAVLVNDVLAALGSPHVVTAGQKKGEHPALFGGVTAAQATEAAAKVNTAVPPAHPATKKPVDLTKIDMSKALSPPKPTFSKSSKAWVNESNNKLADEMEKVFLSGNYTALQAMQFTTINKDDGAVLGKDHISKHPAQEIKSYFEALTVQMREVAYPPEPLKIFDASAAKSLQSLSTSFPGKKFGTTVKKVAANEQLGFWVALGKVSNVEKFVPAKEVKISEAAKQKAYSDYNTKAKANPLVHDFINKIQDAGYYNDYFRDGQDYFPGYNGAKHDTKEMASAVLKYAQEKPAGTRIYKWLGISSDMEKKLFESGPGTVFQNPGSACNSTHPTNTSEFGPHRLNIIYAPGAKAVDSFGSGRFGKEAEITTLPNSRFVILEVKRVPNDNPHFKKDKTRLDLTVLMLPPDDGLGLGVGP